jgi:hypothetical protein
MTALYIISAVLLLVPSSLLGSAWRREIKNRQESVQPRWRKYSFQAALFLATAAQLLTMLYFVSFFYNGGDPHGMGPSPGLWSTLGPPSTYTIATSFLLTLLGKGKGKLMLFAWAITIVVAGTMIFLMGMD